MLLDPLTSALVVDDGYDVVVGGRIVVPPGLVAFDGVAVGTGACVCRADDHDGSLVHGVPALTIDISGADAFGRLRTLAWTALSVPERWKVRPDARAVEVEAVAVAPVVLHPGARLNRSGDGWRVDTPVADLLPLG